MFLKLRGLRYGRLALLKTGQDISSLFFQRNHLLGWYRQSVRYWTTTSWTTTSWTWVHVGADLFALRESDEGTQFVTIYRQNHPIIFTPEIISTEDRWHIAACKKVFMHVATKNELDRQFFVWKIIKEEDSVFVHSLWLQTTNWIDP